jgi:phosphate transport system permease protein
MTFNKKVITETAAKTLFSLCAVFSILAVVSILAFLILQGLPAVSKIGFFDFIFGKEWHPYKYDTYDEPLVGSYGLLPMIVGSLYATAGATLIGGGLGVLIAIFLAKFCPKRLKKPLTQIINLLAGIPSVIYGFFGMTVLLPLLGVFAPNGDGSGILAVSIILGIMILPTVTALSKTSIEAVEKSYYEGAVALGTSKEQAVFKVVVPAAKSGILASLVLGIGRAVGETMAVAMISGGNPVFPSSLFSVFRTLTANIVMEMSYAGELQGGALVATGIVLLVFIFLINISFGALVGKKAGKGKDRTKDIKEDKSAAAIEFPQKNTGKKLCKVYKTFSVAAACVGVFSLLSVILFIVVKGAPHISFSLLFGEFEYGKPPTIFPSIIATGMLIALTSVIAFPLGVFAAIYLAEYTKPNSRFVRVIRVAIETLAGIPSIVYGLFGMTFFCGFMGLGTSITAGCLTLALMIIPTTMRSTEEALKSVPREYREASLALGCGKLRTVFKVVLPSALSGIFAGIILGIGRIISESAPVLFTMGASLKPMPNGYSSGGTALTVALYVLGREGHYTNEAYATACVLIVVVLALNLLSTLWGNKLQRKLYGGIKNGNDN